MSIIKGKPVSVTDYGSIVQLVLRTADNRLICVNFDWRMFRAWYNANKPISGTEFEYDTETDTIYGYIDIEVIN